MESPTESLMSILSFLDFVVGCASVVCHVEAMLFDHQWLEYGGDVGLSEVVGRCFWFMKSSASWCDWCLLIRKTLCNLLLACGSIMWFFYILTRSALARKHVMLVCSWFMLGARVVESAAGQLETHGKTHKWTKRQHKILEKWQGGTVIVGMDT